MNPLGKKFVDFLYTDYGVTGPDSYDRLTEAELNSWRAEYSVSYPDILDDATYIDETLLGRRLEAVFRATDDRLKLAALAALGKAFADVIARRADEAGREWVEEAQADGLYAEWREC